MRTLIRHARPIVVICLLCAARASAQPATISLNEDRVLLVNGKKVFPIGFTMPPPPDGKTPNGTDAFQELRSAGGMFVRTGPHGPEARWNDEYMALEKQYMDAAARAEMYCMPWLRELSGVKEGDAETDQKLRAVINAFKDHPGLGIWKGADEPEWGKEPVPPLENAYRIIKEMDPNHPVWIVEAPRGTIDTLRSYNNTRDITGVDIYPVSFPPGIHSLLPNTEISVVGDHVKIMMDVAQGKLPVWTTLQISWSGVVKEGRTLRMPTHFQQRYMAYQSIITGARGLIYFGWHNPQAWTAQDEKLGWNWSYFYKVMRPLMEELGANSPLQPALTAGESTLKLNAKLVGVEYAPIKGLEFLVREVGDDIYLFAAKREGDTVQVKFEGLPPTERVAPVLFEEPRTVKTSVAKDEKGTEFGTFTDWFGPFDVHVYKFKRTGPNPATTKKAQE